MTLKHKENPPVIFPDQALEAQPDPELPWWVGKTRSRQEKALAWELRAKGITYFLPLVSQVQKSQRRVRTSLVPLFSGYIFFQGGGLQRHRALRTGRLAQVLEVQDQQGLHSQLFSLAKAVDLGAELKLCDMVKKGSRVRIAFGPLAGLEGVVLSYKGEARLILNVEAIAQAASVEVSLDQVQPV
ncbi:MAG: transcription termination/antitermination NusG family protein [Thermodesulfobacteriota bacterium]